MTLLLTLLSLLQFSSPAPPEGPSPEPAWPPPQTLLPLVRVVDGDTLWVRRHGRLEKLRLLSVDTQESAGPWDRAAPQASTGEAAPADRGRRSPTAFGTRTSRWLEELLAPLPGIGIVLPPDGPRRDAFGRLLCHVVLPDGRDLNLLLVAEGRSPYFVKYGRSTLLDAAFRRAADRARAAGQGLWATAERAGPDYARLLPWWEARAEAIDAFRRRRDAGEAVVATWELGAQAAAEQAGPPPGGRTTLFGELERFYEERDGSLTVRFAPGGAPGSGMQGAGPRASLPPEARGGVLEARLRASLGPGRQNYWFLRGRPRRGGRGLRWVSDGPSDWHLAGPEPKMGAPACPTPRATTMDKEIELKFAVEDAAAFDRLVRYLDLPSREFHTSVQQVNHFFDTRSLALHANRVVLRLREEGGRHILTLKGKEEQRSDDGAAVERIEVEVQLSPGTALDVLQGSISPRDALAQRLGDRAPHALELLDQAMGTAELHYIGRFENRRTRLSPVPLAVDGGTVHVVFELDQTTFAPDKVDFEIEVEIKETDNLSAVHRKLIDLFQEADVHWRPSTSKAQRFFAISAGG